MSANQGQKLEAVSETENIAEICSAVSFQAHTQPALLYRPNFLGMKLPS